MDNSTEKLTLSDSWVTLSFEDGSDYTTLSTSHRSSMEHLLSEALRETSTPPSSRTSSLISSPPRIISNENSTLVSPHVSGYNSPIIPAKTVPLSNALPKLVQNSDDTDWVWDWSSQPSITPFKESQFCHPMPKRTPLSLRNTDVMKYDFFSWKFLHIFLPSIIVSNLLAFGIGIYIGRRLASTAKNA